MTISGAIAAPGGVESLSFDMAQLESLGVEGFETMTPWYTGVVRFDGVRMTRLMQAVGAAGTSVTAVALNDYTTEVPVSDFEKYGVILATKRDGNYMPVRDKGPLFIVYPYDSIPELKAQRYYGRSAWQVTRLIVS
ncbi:MAG: oxidoreductase [Acetobacteraceae bacterium]